MGFMSTTHFFLPLRGAGRWRRAAQEIHSTAGGARAKSRWKSRAGAESTRLVVLVPKITVLRAWDTQGLFARSRLRRMLRPRPHQRCPRQAHRHRRPRPTLPSLSPPASLPSPPPTSPSLPPPSPSRRHHHRHPPAATAYATLSLAVAVAAFAFATVLSRASRGVPLTLTYALWSLHLAHKSTNQSI